MRNSDSVRLRNRSASSGRDFRMAGEIAESRDQTRVWSKVANIASPAVRRRLKLRRVRYQKETHRRETCEGWPTQGEFINWKDSLASPRGPLLPYRERRSSRMTHQLITDQLMCNYGWKLSNLARSIALGRGVWREKDTEISMKKGGGNQREPILPVIAAGSSIWGVNYAIRRRSRRIIYKLTQETLLGELIAPSIDRRYSSTVTKFSLYVLGI